MKHVGGVLLIPCLFVLHSSCVAFGQTLATNQPPSTNPYRERVEAFAGTNFSTEKRPFYHDLYEGARMSFSAWDISVLAASSLLERYQPGRSAALQPFWVDHEISEMSTRQDGKKSLGAINPIYYPGLVATSRLLGMIALDAVGLHDYSATTYAKMFRFHQALYYTKVVTYLAKRNIRRYRPDASDTYSFLSGHTSTAFATSTFLYLEARDFIDGLAQQGDQHLPLLSPRGWKMLSFGALYGWAGYVGYSRIHDRRHYLSDVLAGAASGTLVSYLLYPHPAKTGNIRMDLQPMRGGAALGLGVQF